MALLEHTTCSHAKQGVLWPLSREGENEAGGGCGGTGVEVFEFPRLLPQAIDAL